MRGAWRWLGRRRERGRTRPRWLGRLTMCVRALTPSDNLLRTDTETCTQLHLSLFPLPSSSTPSPALQPFRILSPKHSPSPSSSQGSAGYSFRPDGNFLAVLERHQARDVIGVYSTGSSSGGGEWALVKVRPFLRFTLADGADEGAAAEHHTSRPDLRPRRPLLVPLRPIHSRLVVHNRRAFLPSSPFSLELKGVSGSSTPCMSSLRPARSSQPTRPTPRSLLLPSPPRPPHDPQRAPSPFLHLPQRQQQPGRKTAPASTAPPTPTSGSGSAPSPGVEMASG